MKLAVATPGSGLALGAVAWMLLPAASHSLRPLQSSLVRDGMLELPYRQTLKNFKNVQYTAEIEIGEQEFQGIYDTGSFEVLVRSSRCRDCVGAGPAYYHDKSPTYVLDGTKKVDTFGSGSCAVMMGYDTISIGPMTTTGHSFWEIVSHQIPILETAAFTAIVGIGPKFGYDSNKTTLLMSYGVRAFTICLGKESESDGYLTWLPEQDGEEDGVTDVATLSVIGSHHWATKLTRVTAYQEWHASPAHEPCSSASGCVAILDSGTSLIAAPLEALELLDTQMPQINKDCSNMNDLPDLRLVLDGHEVLLPPEAYVMRVKASDLSQSVIPKVIDWVIQKLGIVTTTYVCTPAFMQFEMESQHGPVWILGMPFFRHYHTSFDREKQQMQLAKATEDCGRAPMSERVPQASLFTTGVNASRRLQVPMEIDLASLVPPRMSLVSTGGTKGEIIL